MNTLQVFLAAATRKAASDLETALLRLPAEKRNWSAGGEARSALDMVAECAILNGVTAGTIQARLFPADFDYAAYTREKTVLSQDESALFRLLGANTARVIEAIEAVPDAALATEVAMPWGVMSLAQIVAYPFWNMGYHEGQINFLAAMLGCLK